MIESSGAHNFIAERDWQATVVEFAEAHGWIVWYTHQSGPGWGKGRHSPSGEPDLRMVRPPKVVFAELKQVGGKMTQKQTAALMLLNHCPGVEAYCWTPADWENVQRVLD